MTRERWVLATGLVALGLVLGGLLAGTIHGATGLLFVITVVALLVVATSAVRVPLAPAVVRLGAIGVLLPLIALANQSRRFPFYSAGLLLAGLALVAATRAAGRLDPATPRVVDPWRRRVRWGIAAASFFLAVLASLYQVSALSTPIAPDTVTYFSTLATFFQRAPGGVWARTPQYPFLFALVGALGGSGRHVLAVQFAARALGVAAVAWLLGRRSLVAAALVGAALALDPIGSATSVVYLTESLYSTGLLVALAIFVSQAERGAAVRLPELFAAGVVYGLAFIVRPNGAALIVPVVLAYAAVTRSLKRAVMPLAGFAAVAAAIVLLNVWRSNVPQLAPTGVYVAFPLFIQHLFHPRNGPASADMHRHLIACEPDLDYRKVTPATADLYIHVKFSPCLYHALGESQVAVFDAYRRAYVEAVVAHPLVFARRIARESLRFLGVTAAYYPAQIAGFTNHDFRALCERTGEWKDWPAAPIDFVCPLPAFDPVRRDRTAPIGFALRMFYQPYLYVHQPHLVMAGFHETPVPELAGFTGIVFCLLVLVVVRPAYRIWIAGGTVVLLYSAVTTAAGLAAHTRYLAVTSPLLLIMTVLFVTSLGAEGVACARVGAATLRRRVGRAGLPAAADGGPPAPAEPPPAPAPPASPTAARFRVPSEQGLADLREILFRRYYNSNTAYLATDEGRRDLENNLTHRLNEDRKRFAPWLDGLRPLKGGRVLEIGCGTGSSTVALAEQGARVVGVDIDPVYVDIARVRCRAYGIDDVTFCVADAANLPPAIAEQQFDMVIFFASLEHMLLEERLQAMVLAWRMVAPGGVWCVTDTPNRLWYFDTHTALMNFFHWLPDDLALAYSRFSTRPSVRDQRRDADPAAMRSFLRNGRGVSFHEFELALGPLAARQVHCLEAPFLEYVRRQPLEGLSTPEKYVRVLMEIAPDVSPAFFLESLDLAIVKP